MAPDIPHVAADETVGSIVEILDDVGAVIIDGLIDDDQIAGIRSDLGSHVDAAPSDPELINEGVQFFFAGVRHVTGLTAKSPTFVDALLLNPTLLSVADTWFDEVASSYQLNIAHLLLRDPGSERQLWHRDEDVWVHLRRMLSGVEPNPHLQVAVITALCDFTPEIGATALVPGSHRWDPDRQPREDEVVAATMSAGSAVVYRGSVLHAGGANRSNEPRPGIHHSYVVGWLRTEESGLLAALPDVARHLPPRAQELVGYECHDAIDELGGYLGSLDLRNPADLLRDGLL